MSHEPGRERFMLYRCEQCNRATNPLTYSRSHDAYLCGECFSSLAPIELDVEPEARDAS